MTGGSVSTASQYKPYRGKETVDGRGQVNAGAGGKRHSHNLKGGEDLVTMFFTDKAAKPFKAMFLPIVTGVTDRIKLATQCNQIAAQIEQCGLIKLQAGAEAHRNLRHRQSARRPLLHSRRSGIAHPPQSAGRWKRHSEESVRDFA